MAIKRFKDLLIDHPENIYALFSWGFSGGSPQCGRPGFDPWVGKIPWRRKWQPTPVFLPGESHGRRSLVDYSPWGCKESDTTEWLHFHFPVFLFVYFVSLEISNILFSPSFLKFTMICFVIGLSPVLDILGAFGVGKLFSYLEHFINYLCTYFWSLSSGIFDQILHFYTYPSKFSFYFLALLSRSFPQLYFQFFFECFVSITLYLISKVSLYSLTFLLKIAFFPMA